MTIIYAATEDQHLVATILPKLAQNNVNTVRLSVDFDASWSTYTTRRAIFTTSKSVRPYSVNMSSGGDCLIPPEVLAEECQLYIVVEGVNSSTGAKKSSTRLTVKVLGGHPAVIISDPSPSVYQQLLTANAALSSRMSGLEAAGTVEGSEVIGIRTGADGKVYPTAGDAVREQVVRRAGYTPIVGNPSVFARNIRYEDFITGETDGEYHRVQISEATLSEANTPDGKRWTYWRCTHDITPLVGLGATLYITIEGDSPTWSINRVLLSQTHDWSKPIVSFDAQIVDGKLVVSLDEIDADLSAYEYVYLVVGSNEYFEADSAGKFHIPAATLAFKVSAAIEGEHEVLATHLKGFDVKDYNNFREAVNFQQAIVCWGDSLTAQGGWTTKLQELSGMTVYNAGTGGENVRTITARQGADVIMVNDVTIPATSTPVTLATYTSPFRTALGYTATPLLQGGAHVNPVKIGGIEGTLKWTGSSYSDTSGTWTFTRTEAGEQLVINRPTALTTAYDREKNSPYLMVIFMGQNGGYNSDDEELVNLHRLMIAHANAKHVIILGLSSGSATSRAGYEAAMRKAFGRYFISLREYLSQYGLADAGLTPTTADSTAMLGGTVPPQLLTDGTHFTNATKTVIGNLIYKRCCELGIFEA